MNPFPRPARVSSRLLASRLLASLAVAGLVLGACGGSDGESIASQRERLVDQLVTEAESSGADVDRSCLADVAADLSDSDVEKIVEAGVDGTADVSADSEDLALQMADCITSLDGSTPISTPTSTGANASDDTVGSGETIPAGALSAIVEQVAASVEATGGTVDRDCLAAALDGVDLGDIVSKVADPAFMAQFSTCIEAGSGSAPAGTIAGGDTAITDQMIEQVAVGIESSGGTVDRDCLKAALSDMTMDDVMARATDPTFWGEFSECVSGV